jgi:hypothetical protein
MCASCFFDFYVWRAICAGRTVFILFGACKSNPFSPHDPKTLKTVMQKQGAKSKTVSVFTLY